MNIKTTKKENLFIASYLETIDFTDCGDIDQPEHGTELDPTYLRECVIDCLAFYSRVACYLSDDDVENGVKHVAYDFWLSRNGHGAGFFDRGYPMAETFQKWAESYGGSDPIFEDFELGSD